MLPEELLDPAAPDLVALSQTMESTAGSAQTAQVPGVLEVLEDGEVELVWQVEESAGHRHRHAVLAEALSMSLARRLAADGGERK